VGGSRKKHFALSVKKMMGLLFKSEKGASGYDLEPEIQEVHKSGSAYVPSFPDKRSCTRTSKTEHETVALYKQLIFI
jgi:hypothetical protein